jgi:hypothetical protein
MKRTSLFISVMLLSIIGLTSCLDMGDNKGSDSAYGVLTRSSVNSNTLLLKTTVGTVSSPQLSEWVASGKMVEEKCYSIHFEIDFSLPENSAVTTQMRGYSMVTIDEYTELPTYHANSYLTDTATVLTDEVAVSNGYVLNSSVYGGGYMYVQQIVNQPADQALEWDMSYDYDMLTNPTGESGIRYYDLFVRAKKLTDGTKSNADTPYLNAYYMSDFLYRAAENERYLLGGNYNENSIFKFRVFYAKEIKDGKITWQNAVQDVYINLFLTD